MSETKKKSTKVAIETAETGWIVRVHGEGISEDFCQVGGSGLLHPGHAH